MKKGYIVGIGGWSASGKSTVSDYLEKNLDPLKVKAFHMDDYYKEEAQRPYITGILDGKQYIDDNHPSALDMEKFYDDVGRAVLDDWNIIILEGIFVLWDEKILPMLDFKIYVDCDSEERLVRRIKRHIAYGQDFDEITQRYIQAVLPRHKEYVEATKWRADIILNGFQMPALGMDVVLAWMRRAADNQI